ncbi:MAG: pyridoxal 5'-phosphate synthase glutaminase subunit PdxT [Spirochaetales bacterium]|nr:pyridoxal 5'-phosphate synthase glutaminase subunit PdxT [Spirochaetales bacterium]
MNQSSALPSAFIGILALQGGVDEHITHLQRCGVSPRLVRNPHELEGLSGLIIPGGESTCIRRLMVQSQLDQAIIRAHREGMYIWGTCAGAILCAAEIEGESPVLGIIDISIKRNKFGSQLGSFTTEAVVEAISPEPQKIVCIRAPGITRLGPGVRSLLSIRGFTAAAQSESVLVSIFHPELTDSSVFHAYFLQRCGISMDTEPFKAVNRLAAFDNFCSLS